MEEQAIDFSELTEVGLFGIFGPTGSGKSTILDAITLALYGEIPRAGRDLSGVVNSHSDKADIYYEFQIGNKKDKRTYFVQRCYKKDKNGSVNTHIVKLCDITDQDNPIVLGEKVNAVNNKVGEILGLTCNDFTRSVVLPQGNFSDFLKLSGRDKRDMLERIFALQEYGGRLTKKIRDHKNKVDSELMVIQGQLQHFDGISQGAFQALKQEIKDLEEKKIHLAEQAKQIEEKYETSHALWKLQEEYKGYQVKKEKLDQNQDTIEDYKKQYELAQRAKNIQPYIKSHQETQNKIKNREQDLQRVQRQYQQLVTSLDTLKEKWEQQKEKKENHLPLLVNKKINLENAIKQSHKKNILEREWKKLTQQEEELSLILKQREDEIEHLIEQLDQLTTKVVERQEQREKGRHSPEYGEKLYQAYDIEKQYKKILKNHEDLIKYIQVSQEKYLYPLRKEEKKIQGALQELEEKIQKSERQQTSIQHQIEERKYQNMAALLAKSLEDNQSCPVCGSLHHPQKADYPQNQEINTLEQYKENLEKSIETLKEQKEKILLTQQKILQDIYGRERLVQEKEREAQTAKEERDGLEKQYEQYKDKFKTKNIEIKVQEYHKKLQQDEKLQREIKTLQESKEKQEILQRQLQEKLYAENTQLTRIQQSIIERQNLIKDLQRDIEKVCGKNSPQKEMDNVSREIDQMKKLFTRIEQEYNEKSNYKNELEKDQRGLQDILSQLHEFQESIEENLQQALVDNDFSDVEEVINSFKSIEERKKLQEIIEQHQHQLGLIKDNMERLEKHMEGNSITQEQWENLLEKRQQINQNLEEGKALLVERKTQADTMAEQLKKLQKLQKQQKDLEHKQGLIEEINRLFQGNKFVEFISLRQLRYIAKEASGELKRITRGRYALELDDQGNFIMRDDFNGGVRRSTRTLSGGETFLTSLSLALALSSHIQLKGRAPLEFFFLDEGFGTLDSSLLEVVMDSLERLHSEKLSVGLISHVDELKQRIPRRLMVSPAVAGMNGTKVKMEMS